MARNNMTKKLKRRLYEEFERGLALIRRQTGAYGMEMVEIALDMADGHVKSARKLLRAWTADPTSFPA